MKTSTYTEHSGKVAEAFGHIHHVMAIALDPRTEYKQGVIRCITSREGDVTVSGYVDRSELRKVSGDSLEKFVIGDRLTIKNEEEIIAEISKSKLDFIGLEDPDIFIDDDDKMHLYFTMPFRSIETKHTYGIYLGHAVGDDLDSLEMTMPVLMTDKTGHGAKEVSIAPKNSKGFRYNLIESSVTEPDFSYSTVRVALAHDMGSSWEFGETVIHPKILGIPWVGGHASPGPLLPKSFIDLGPGKLLGILNGRETNKKVNGKTVYGMFSVGLFIYDYKKGKVDWVSTEPLIIDSEARTITFASQFVETTPGEGILYAHVDDSFVRAYTLKAEGIRELLPKV